MRILRPPEFDCKVRHGARLGEVARVRRLWALRAGGGGRCSGKSNASGDYGLDAALPSGSLVFIKLEM